MTWDEYNKLFHKLQLNLVAFKPLMECDAEVLKLVNFAIEQEREACAKVCEAMRPSKEEFDQRYYAGCTDSAAAIRAKGQA